MHLVNLSFAKLFDKAALKQRAKGELMIDM